VSLAGYRPDEFPLAFLRYRGLFIGAALLVVLAGPALRPAAAETERFEDPGRVARELSAGIRKQFRIGGSGMFLLPFRGRDAAAAQALHESLRPKSSYKITGRRVRDVAEELGSLGIDRAHAEPTALWLAVAGRAPAEQLPVAALPDAPNKRPLRHTARLARGLTRLRRDVSTPSEQGTHLDPAYATLLFGFGADGLDLDDLDRAAARYGTSVFRSAQQLESYSSGPLETYERHAPESAPFPGIVVIAQDPGLGLVERSQMLRGDGAEVARERQELRNRAQWYRDNSSVDPNHFIPHNAPKTDAARSTLVAFYGLEER
jgi:hypothetical protein